METDNQERRTSKRDNKNMSTNRPKPNPNKPYSNSTSEPHTTDYSTTLNDTGNGVCPALPNKPSTRDNESSAKQKTSFKVYSHNVNGLRDDSKLEFIPRMMKPKGIDAYLIQETHLSGDFEKSIFGGYYLIHHGPQKQPQKGAKGGVAIILSPELADQWRNNGRSKEIVRGGNSIGETISQIHHHQRPDLLPMHAFFPVTAGSYLLLYPYRSSDRQRCSWFVRCDAFYQSLAALQLGSTMGQRCIRNQPQ